MHLTKTEVKKSIFPACGQFQFSLFCVPDLGKCLFLAPDLIQHKL